MICIQGDETLKKKNYRTKDSLGVARMVWVVGSWQLALANDEQVEVITAYRHQLDCDVYREHTAEFCTVDYGSTTCL